MFCKLLKNIKIDFRTENIINFLDVENIKVIKIRPKDKISTRMKVFFFVFFVYQNE